MFGSKEDNYKPSKNGTLSSGTSINLIGERTKINGDLDSESDVRIDGRIKGKVTLDAKLVVGPKGVIEGNVDCNSADISGKIKGRIRVKELLFLKGTALIDGEIVTNKLVVESGASFNGQCTMGSVNEVKDEEKAAPNLTKEVI